MRFTKEVKISYLAPKLMSPIGKKVSVGKHIAINVLGELLWIELHSSKRYVEVLTPKTMNVALLES